MCMANVEEQIRDDRGEWQPDVRPAPSPLFSWPLRPVKILKYLIFKFLIPYNVIYLLLGVVSWLFLTPELSRMSTFSFDWIALIYLRNAGLLTLIAGGLHLRLYVKRAQGQRYKYSDRWLATKDKKFLFHNQTWDNIFWNFASGVVIWTAFEAVTLWAYANEFIPYVDWRAHPVYSVLLLIAVVFMRETHFYWTHRFTHWKPLYKSAHYLHHKNINIGPWSGMSMHPIEHLLYLSGILLHWIIPSHPIHAISHAMHAGLSPAKGHTGFNKFVVSGARSVETERVLNAGGYFHYLHHRFFTVNFGNETVPLDKWFGSFHDGSEEAHMTMMARRKSRSA